MAEIKFVGRDSLLAYDALLRGTFVKSSSIVDNCDSTDASAPLSANQGARLQDQIDTIKDQISDVLYKEISITSFINNVNTVELGSTVDSVTLTWETNKTPATLTLDNNSINAALKSYTYTGLALSPTSQQSVKYTLVATDDREASASKDTYVTFVNGVYYGVIDSGKEVDSSAILALTRSLQNKKAKTFTATAGDGQYIVYALPSRYGTPAFNVGGLDGGFHLETNLQFTNSSGYTETYNVYFSDNLALGETTVKTT